jgi:hypothetical protein
VGYLLQEIQPSTEYSITPSKTILKFVPMCFGQSMPSSGEQSTHAGRYRSLHIASQAYTLL